VLPVLSSHGDVVFPFYRSKSAGLVKTGLSLVCVEELKLPEIEETGWLPPSFPPRRIGELSLSSPDVLLPLIPS